MSQMLSKFPDLGDQMTGPHRWCDARVKTRGFGPRPTGFASLPTHVVGDLDMLLDLFRLVSFL